MNDAEDQVEDVWLEMLTYHAEHPNCTIEDLNLPRFLRHAVGILKHFEELVSESLAIPMRIDQILRFAELILDEKLFDALIRNLRELPRVKQQTQAGLFYLILEVCQVKKQGYKKWCHDILVTGMTPPDAPIFTEIGNTVTRLDAVMKKYHQVLLRDFAHCAKVVEAVRNAMAEWAMKEQ